MKPLIVANWKCNLTTLIEAKLLFNSVANGIKNIKNAEVVICPPFIWLVYLLNPKPFTLNPKFGGQDCFWEEKGAYTGEISPSMLRGLGVEYVIIGHSERRRLLNETDEMVNKKLKAVLRRKLKPIFCIGETQEEKEKGETIEVIKSQIKKGLEGIPKKEIKNIVIAYEPVWAIGTGKSCLPDEAMTVSLSIRKFLAKIFGPANSKNIKIIYGGSVNSQNVKSYISEAGMDGVLVGEASLDPKEFINLVKNVSKG